jgi:transposase
MHRELTDGEWTAVKPMLPSTPRGYYLSDYLRRWLAHVPKARGTLKLEVDVDPQSFSRA